MSTLKIGNSYSQLSDLSVEDYRILKRSMSYTVDSGPGTRPRTVSLLSKKLEFPTGLLYIVEDYFDGVDCRANDLRIKPQELLNAPETLFRFGSMPEPYPDQRCAVAALIAANGRGIVSAPTGSGKAFMIAMTINYFKVKTLVVVPSLELKRQLTESLLGWFGKDNFKRFVTVSNVDSLDTGVVLKDTGMVILDEIHHSAAKTYRDLNRKAWVNVYHRAGFTATPFRNDENERLLFESFLSNIVYRVTYTQAVSQKYIVPVEAYYLSVPKTKLLGNQKSYPAMYSENIVGNDIRNTRIAVALARLHSQGKSTLCLVREIKHGEILSGKTYFPFANGQDGQSTELIKAFNTGEIKTLIATTGVMGEGIDSRPAEWIVIAGAGKARTQLMQNIGRGVRNYPGKESCKVLLLCDSSHAWFRSHYREQAKIIREEYGVEPAEILI